MLEIQRIDADAWRTYRDLRLASLADAPSAFGSRLERERLRDELEWRGRLADRTQFVAMIDGRAVGTVGARSGADGTTELVSLWVAPEARRSGVGERLVRTVGDEAVRRRAPRVVLWVSEGNDPAERLYTRLGFVRTGARQPIDDEDPGRGNEVEMRWEEADRHA